MKRLLYLLWPAVLLNACGGASPSSAPPPIAEPVRSSFMPARDTAQSRQTLYVPDFSSNVVTTYGMNGKAGLTIAQGLAGPFGVAVDSSGKIYVTNVHSGEVTTYLPNGSQTTPTISGIFLPWGIAVGKSGKIYVTSGENASCTSTTLTTYTPEGIRTTPTIKIPGEPVGVAVDAAGKIYVANVCAGPSGLGSVATYKANGTPTTPILTDKDNVDEPVGVTVVGNKLFVANSGGSYHHSLYGYVTAYTLAGKEIAPSIGQGTEGPTSVAVDDAGDIFVANSLAGTYGDITKFLPNGSQTKPTIRKGVRQANIIAIH